MKKTICIDGRMWGSAFTGIGQYLRHVGGRLLQGYGNDAEWVVLGDLKNKMVGVAPPQPPLKRGLLLPPFKGGWGGASGSNYRQFPADQPIYSLREQTQLPQLLRAQHADLYWFPHFNVPLLFRRPFVCTIHDLTILKYQGKKLCRPWHRWAYLATLHHALRNSIKVIAVSQATKDDILQFFPQTPADKIVVIHNGFDPTEWSAGDKPRTITGDYFICAGVHREHKNLPRAITAYEQYRRAGGRSKLVITGKADPSYPEVEQLARESEFTTDIMLTGFVPQSELPALIANARALFFPSLAEGFGLPALEAMAVGTPVIASNTSSLPETCGDAALLVDPHSTRQLATALGTVEETGVRSRLIKLGYKRINEFSWDRATSAHWQIFDAYLQSK